MVAGEEKRINEMGDDEVIAGVEMERAMLRNTGVETKWAARSATGVETKWALLRNAGVGATWVVVMKLLKKCGCGAYTLGEKCPRCGAKTFSAHPPKYSPEDRLAEYRRKAKYGAKHG